MLQDRIFGNARAFLSFPEAYIWPLRLNDAEGGIMALRQKRKRVRRDRSKPASGFRHTHAGSLKAPDAQDDLIDEAVALWQSHADRPLTREDGREIVENLTGFFGLLEEWRFAEQVAKIKKTKQSATPDDEKTGSQEANDRHTDAG